MYFKGGYIQRGHGLWGIFRSVAKIFRPIVRNITKVVNKPEVRKILKNVGKSAVNTGSELLIDSLRGKDVKAKLKRKIDLGKQKLTDSIAEGISKARRAKKTEHEYQRLYDDIYNSNDILENPKFTKVRKHLNSLTRKTNRRLKRNVKYKSVFD